MFDRQPHLDENQIRNILRIPISFEKLTGRQLLGGTQSLLEDLWTSPLAIVAHDDQADPIFFYGNAVALSLFERDFENFTQLPSRLSAEPLMREDRARFLSRVHVSGIIDDYEGIRISATGKRFLIQNAIVWNLLDKEDSIRGQAAAFSNWTYLNKK